MAKDKYEVLICDDDETVRHLLREMLENEGYDCIEAANAQETLVAFETALADVVLLDIKLPGESGLDLIPHLIRRYSDTLIIVVTAINELDVAIQCIRKGAYDYITKPVNTDEVISCTKRAIETRGLQLKIREYQRHLEERVEEQAEEIRGSFLGAMSALSFALEAKDNYTAGHSRRVADVAVAIGKKLSLSQDELDDLRWGSLLHDFAKIAVDELIIHKNGKLTPEEYEHVMTHPIVGACLAASLVRNKRIIEIIEHHHAHYNGSGLRQTRNGDDIPLLARIVAVADAYDAMTSNRPYRSALSRGEALAVVRNEVGRQFDPRIANIFLGMSEEDIIQKREKILIADDEESIRLLVRSIMGNDYVVIEAADGQEAVESANKEKPILILMDILMPKKDGLQACYEIKSNSATKEIPVVILTGIDKELNRRLSHELGAAGYITKPFTAQDLINAVRKFAQN